MKKLNEKQKQHIKQSATKALNITCYVVSGFAVLVGLLVGLKSCVDKKTTNSVATTPVVNNLINRNDRVDINDNLKPTTDGDETYPTYVYEDNPAYMVSVNDFMKYIYNATYTYDSRDFRDFNNWPTSWQNTTVIDFGLGNNFIKFTSHGRDDGGDPVDDTYTGYRLTFSNNSSFRLYYTKTLFNLISFSNMSDYEVLCNLSFEIPEELITSGGYDNVNILPGFNVANPAKRLYDLLNDPNDEYLICYEFTSCISNTSYVNQPLTLGNYIFPYGVYGNPGFFGGITTSMPYGFCCLFDGSFTCNNVDYTHIFLRQYSKDTATFVFGAPVNVTACRDIIYYNQNTGTTTVIASSNYNNFPKVINPGGPNFWTFGRIAYINDIYKNIIVHNGYYGYEKAYGYTLTGDALLGVNVVFSGNFNGYTQSTGTINTDGDDIHSDIPDYNTGENVGQPAWNSVFGLLGMAFSSVASIFGYQILPGVSIGTLVFLPLVVTIVIFIIWLVKR